MLLSCQSFLSPIYCTKSWKKNVENKTKPNQTKKTKPNKNDLVKAIKKE